MPYERIVQWLAGPAAIVGGWLASFLATHLSVFGHIDQHRASGYIAKAIVFAAGALATYAAHHKWLSNVPEWWLASGLTEPADPQAEIGPEPAGVEVTSRLESAVTPDDPDASTAFQPPPGFKLVPDDAPVA